MVKNSSVILLTVILAASGLTAMAVAQTKEGAARESKPGVVIVEVARRTGTVKAIDQGKKTVTVEGTGGRTIVLNAKNARNLDQVKVGDKVKVEFTEEVALFVRKSDAAPSATETQRVELAPKGQKPSGLVAETVELTGSVESVDPEKRTIAVKGPAGNVRTLKVDKAVKNFDQIKKGDQIVLRFTEAFALSVAKP